MAINEKNYVGFAIDPRTGKPHNLRHLPKMAEWEKGVYLYECGDKFIADVDGIDNLPGQQLANRTEFLYEQNNLLGDACRGLLSILRDTTVGKVSVNGYPVTMADEKPAGPVAWIKPADGTASAQDMAFVVTEPGGASWDNPVAYVLPEDLPECYVGSDHSAFPRVRRIAGTYSVDMSPADLRNQDAWVKTEGFTDNLYNVSAEVHLDDETIIHSPTGVLVDTEDNVFYVKTYEGGGEPTPDIDGFEIATHGDIDSIFPVTR
jgi:hypothetical protein